MNRLDFAALAATLTFCLSPTTATADADRVPLTARIAVRDLDLASRVGQRQFRRRVDHAAASTCGVGMSIRERLDVLRCHTEMRRDAQIRLAALAHSRKIEVAAITSR